MRNPCGSTWRKIMQKYIIYLLIVWFCLFMPSVSKAQNDISIHQVNGEYVREWLVLGPFFPGDLETDFLTDAGGEVNVTPKEGDIVINEQGDTLTWKRYGTHKSIVDLLRGIGYYESAVAYAFCILRSRTEQKVQILLGSNDGVSVWINGEQVHHNPVNRWLTVDEDQFEADLLQGSNRCLIKVSQDAGGWNFTMRTFPIDQPITAEPKFFLSLEDMMVGYLLTASLWRYHSGDNIEWAQPNFDDSSWELIDPELRENVLPESGWNGIGWFRLHLIVDSTLWNWPLALNVWQWGAASEIYLDGIPIAQYGKVGLSRLDEEGYITTSDFLPPPKSIVFSKTDHVLAVRLSNFYSTSPQRWEGFEMILSDLNSTVALNASQRRTNINIQMTVTIIPVVFAILHMLLFLFYRRAKENLYYALFTLLLGATFFGACQVGFSLVTDLLQMVFLVKLIQALLTVAFIAALRFLYGIFYPRLPKQFWIFLLLGAGWIVWQWTHFLILWQLGTGLILIMLFEMLRVAVVAIRKKKGGAWIIGTGFIFFTVTFICGILVQSAVLPYDFNVMNVLYLSSLFGLLLSMSVFLARRISRTEVDNARKTMELEEARKLQLSMLPETIPPHPNLEIAVSMRTANEVGGDYYDFKLHDDGTLTVAIGDATGHSMKAGTMVSVIKSLFIAEASQMDILSFFKKCSRTIKEMRLGNLYMALMLIKIKNHQMTVSSAGMPPVYIYRKDKETVEEILIKGVPLGGPGSFSYKKKKVVLNSGDTVLLMSDGLPELFNDKNEVLDYTRVKEIFRETAENPPNDVIAHLMKAGEQWSKGRLQNDDMTFVVLKYKSLPKKM